MRHIWRWFLLHCWPWYHENRFPTSASELATLYTPVEQTLLTCTPEVRTHALLGALYETYIQLSVEQSHLFVELGQNASRQFALATTLAHNLASSGIPPYRADIVGRYLAEREIAELLWGILCHERTEKLYSYTYLCIRERVRATPESMMIATLPAPPFPLPLPSRQRRNLHARRQRQRQRTTRT